MLHGETFYVGSCTEGGMRKVQISKFHYPTYSFSPKRILIIISVKCISATLVQNGIPRISLKSISDKQGKLHTDGLPVLKAMQILEIKMYKTKKNTSVTTVFIH
jgi:hypothetical protein